MAVYSMTGYASGQFQATPDVVAPNPNAASASALSGAGAVASAPQRLGLELRSVNSRFLDITFKLPEELRPFEAALRDLIQTQCKRGKMELRASIEGTASSTVADPSGKLLQRLAMVQNAVHNWLPSAAPLSVADVVRLAITEAGQTQDWGADVVSGTQTVLTALMQARAREGARLAAMLQGHIKALRVLVTQAAPLVPQLMELQRLRFLERWKDALALADASALPDAARERALTEAAAFAIRADIAEELTRLKSHLDEIERLLKKGGELGKRLDFLIQELHREANTLGSKSASLEMTHISVDMKVLIEQMREQVQNIE
jgi:uncharacterized protein (TIGR00255 family)